MPLNYFNNQYDKFDRYDIMGICRRNSTRWFYLLIRAIGRDGSKVV